MIKYMVTITAWLSFLMAVWFFLFELLPWQAPVIMLFITVTVAVFGWLPPSKR